MIRLMGLITVKKNNSFGYEKLIPFWLGSTIYDVTVVFTSRYIPYGSRTKDQMDQAARSGKQNIVEGSLELSCEGNLKLTGIGRASFGELLEDAKDFLRQHNLPLWDKNDPRVWEIRKTLDLPYRSYKTYITYTKNMNNPEDFANLLVTLCYKEMYLLSKLLAAQEEEFVKKGGFRENLFKKRREYQNQNGFN